MQERTLVLIKPDAVERNIMGKILNELERNEMTIYEMKFMTASKSTAEAHYANLVDRPFFHEVIDYITRGPLVALIIEGENAVERVRELVGETDPKKAAPHTLRALYGKDKTENSVHASDSKESAEREIALWFN